MANMSAIKLPDGITYNLVDKTSGYIKSYTDEKLKVEVDDGNQYYPVLTSSSTTASTKKYSNLLNFTTYGSAKCLAIGGTASDSTKKAGALRLFNDAGGSVTLQFDSTATYSRGIIIPNKGGSNVTLATLQDIPAVPTNVSAFTNDAGYTTNTGTVTKVTAGTGLSIGTTAGGNFTISGTINHTNSVTAQTTQAVYPIKIDAQGHISAYGSAVTIPTVPSNIVNTITTTAGAHTVISSQKGNVSFKVPTKTSHLTNDSGFITSIPEAHELDYTQDNGAEAYTIYPTIGEALDASIVGMEYALETLPDKQDSLVSGTNIKTINSTSLLGSGNIAVQPTLVSGTNIKTVNSTSLLGSGNVAVQPTLVSGTNIKTINNQSLLGSGNITIEDGSDIKLYYESGDSITYGEYESGLVITGFVTSSKTEDHYTIPLSKPCTASTVSITNFGIICRQDANYVHGTGATTYKTPSYTAALTGQDSDGAYTSIKIVCTWSNTSNVVNNAPMAANIRGVFTFS